MYKVKENQHVRRLCSVRLIEKEWNAREIS